MNTEQLECALNELKLSINHNVCSSDNLPRDVTYPNITVCNTDPSHLPGKHWVVFWLQNPTHAEFYDSLGKLPSHYSEHFSDFLKKNSTSCLYNNVRVQRKGTVSCGYHVLFYILMKVKNISMCEIVHRLKQCNSPDKYVYEYVSHDFKCL